MMKINIKKHINFGLLTIATIVFLVALNLLIFLFAGDANIDITSDGKYSLSSKTSEFLKNNDQQINIRFFISKDLKSKNPKLAEYAEYLRKIFMEYKNESNNLIDFDVVDVVPFENSQFEAEKYGIKEFDLSDGIKYQYLGASFSNSNGKFRSIPNFYPERKNFVEDDITRLLSIVSEKNKQYLGIISPMFSVADEKNPTKLIPNWPFVKSMEAFGYTVLPIRSTTPVIDENIDVVLLLYPVNISSTLIYALDQYLVKGGSVVIMMDSFSEERFREQEEFYSYRSKILDFLQNFGVSYDEDLVVGDNINSRNLIMENRSIRYPFKVNITKSMMASHPINENIDLVYYNHGGFFEYEEQDNLVATVLAKTSANSGIMTAHKFTDLGYDDLLKNYVYSNENYVLSLLLEGKFEPYYKYPPINSKDLIEKLPVFVNVAEKEGKLLLLGDADIVNEVLWNADIGEKNGIFNIRYSSDNLLFLRNIFDYMAGNNYVSAGKKYVEKSNKNLVDVFQKYAIKYYNDERQKILVQIAEVKEKLMNIEVNKSEFDAFSIKKIKEKELLSRKETEANLALGKIAYLIGERYNLYRMIFSIFVILIIPLSSVVSIWIAYACYYNKLVKKTKDYINE